MVERKKIKVGVIVDHGRGDFNDIKDNGKKEGGGEGAEENRRLVFQILGIL